MVKGKLALPCMAVVAAIGALISVFVAQVTATPIPAGGEQVAAMETEFWQQAIDAAAANGGGVVCVPRGRHVVGQLYIKNNVELHLEDGAVLEGAPGLYNYVVHALPYSEGTWSAVVMGLSVTNVAITGNGEIFGNGRKFEPVRTKGVCWEGFRPRGVFFSQCKDVRLEDFLLKDAACWGIVFKCCDGCVVRRVRIDSNANHNNDGFDIEARNVIVEDCDVSCCDDAYCIKSNNPDFVVENVTVRRCVARTHCNAYKIGTASHGVIRNIHFEHCRSELPRRIYRDMAPMPSDYAFGWPEVKGVPHYLCGPGIGAICVECVDGGIVENVSYENIEVFGCQVPIFIRGGQRRFRTCGIPPGNRRRLRNITISHVRGRAESTIPSSITGVDGCRPQEVLLQDVVIECVGEGVSHASIRCPGQETAGRYPEATMFRKYRLPAYGLYVDRPEDVVLEDVRFTLRSGTLDERPSVNCPVSKKERRR